MNITFSLIFILIYLVPTARLELARPIKPRDSKSLVSTIPPRGHPDIRIVLLIFMLQSSQKYHFFIQSEFLISKVFFIFNKFRIILIRVRNNLLWLSAKHFLLASPQKNVFSHILTVACAQTPFSVHK